jgi:hypothetical protein
VTPFSLADINKSFGKNKPCRIHFQNRRGNLPYFHTLEMETKLYCAMSISNYKTRRHHKPDESNHHNVILVIKQYFFPIQAICLLIGAFCVTGSNPLRGTGYPDRGIRGTPRNLWVNPGIVPQLRLRQLPFRSFPILYSPIILRFDAI